LKVRPARRDVEWSLDRLESVYGTPCQARAYPPLDELILTILSQSTNDVNRDRAYERMRRRFPTWKRVLRARRADLEEAIRIGGLAPTKSRVIQEVLGRILKEQGRLSLEVLKRLPVEEARRYLSRFKGVGEKTVCCVLLFACGHPVFPVDTHIQRVTRRLGWVPEGSTPARSHAILARLIPEERYLSAHLNLITLGRRICRPRNPACDQCRLRRGCRYAARVLGSRPRRPAAVDVARKLGDTVA
jgi:endonuclease III